MSYLVFARKYRPQTFSEVLGQGPIVTTLSNAIRQQRIGQAYLFAGPRGTGKTSTARIFAKSLNCVEGPTVTPCLTCDRCQEITQGRSLDVLEIDGASNRGIDQIRTLRELAKFTPAAGPFKVYIIDEVHQITAEGFNALLKILEEPPAHVLFVLATTAPHKVPATILSRCQRYDFKRLPIEVMTKKLKAIAAEEKLEITEEAVLGIARAASGSLRDAESLLDQSAAFAGGRIGEEDLKSLWGTIDEDLFVEAISGIQAREPVKLLKLVALATNSGSDLIQWTLSFLSFLRNLLVAKVGAGPLGFEEVGEQTIQRLTALAEGFSVAELGAMAQVLSAAVETMRRVGEPRIPLEMALIRLATGESLVSVVELLDRLDRMDQRLQEQGTVPTEDSPPERSSVPSAASAVSLSSSTLEGIVAIWPKLLEEIHRQKASVSAYLTEASPIALEPGDPPRVVIGLPKGFDFHREALERPATRELVEQTLGDLLGVSLRCAFRAVDEIPKMESPPDPSVLTSVLDMFEGRVLPGGS